MKLKAITDDGIPEGYVGWFEDYPATSEVTGESLWAGWCKPINEHEVTLEVGAYFEVMFTIHCPDAGGCTHYALGDERAVDCWVKTWVTELGIEAFDERWTLVDRGKDKPRAYVEEKPLHVGRYILGDKNTEEAPNFTLGVEVMVAGSG